MLIDEYINIRINNKNIEHFINLNYICKYNEIIKIKTKDLKNNSHTKVNVECDICNKPNNIKYQDYCKSLKTYNIYTCPVCKTFKYIQSCMVKYNTDNVSKSDIIKTKKENTCLEKYGVKNPFESEEIKNNIKEYYMTNFNVSHPNRIDEVKQKSKDTRIKNNFQIPDNLLSELQIYYKNVKKETYKFKKELYKNWNGFDYYDNEYILEYKKLNPNNRNYPSIDHKISVYEGFMNNIDYKIIGNINNLCITKRTINSSKRNMNELEYKNKLNKNDN